MTPTVKNEITTMNDFKIREKIQPRFDETEWHDEYWRCNADTADRQMECPLYEPKHPKNFEFFEFECKHTDCDICNVGYYERKTQNDA